MGVGVDSDAYNYILEHWEITGLDWDEYFLEGGEFYYFTDLDDILDRLGLTIVDGEIYTVSTRPSQDGILIGNLE